MSSFSSQWPILKNRAARLWRETDAAEMDRLDGSRDAFVDYLSVRHDLTKAEAHDTVETWLLTITDEELRLTAAE